MTLLWFIREWSSVLLFGLNIVLAVLVWVARRTIATKDDIESVTDLVAGIERRVSSLEQQRESVPTHGDLAALQLQMEQMRGDLRAFAAEVNGTREMIQTQLDTLRSLLRPTERALNIVTEHLLSSSEKR